MTQTSRFWGGTVTGDAGPYSNDQFNFIAYTMFGGSSYANAGYSVGFLNELAVTTPSANAVTIASGAAMCAGIWYYNTAAVSLNPTTPGAATSRIDIVCLKADWALQTVRLALHVGVAAGSPTAPALTQTLGTTYEIPLAQASVADTGIVTLTDTRVKLALGFSPSGTAAAGKFVIATGASSFEWAYTADANITLANQVFS